MMIEEDLPSSPLDILPDALLIEVLGQAILRHDGVSPLRDAMQLRCVSRRINDLMIVVSRRACVTVKPHAP